MNKFLNRTKSSLDTKYLSEEREREREKIDIKVRMNIFIQKSLLTKLSLTSIDESELYR